MGLKALARELLARNAVSNSADNSSENPATPPATAAISPDCLEGAAIVEEGAGVPREWADAFARIQDAPMPPNVTSRDWIATLNGVGRFLDGWAVRAHALGWTPAELFGMGKGLRQDRKGAAWLIGAAEVVAVTDDAITLRANTGALSRIYRSTRASVGPTWGEDDR